MPKVLLAYLFLFATLVVLLRISTIPIWNLQLQDDIAVYFERSRLFWENHNLKTLTNNEYQPGAMLFFIALSPIFNLSDSFTTYVSVFVMINILLILLLAFIYHKYSDVKSLYLLSMLLLAAGPIIFFRFDLLVMLMVVLSLYFWEKGNSKTSFFMLALATLVKVYPIIFLPYFLILDYKKMGLKNVQKHLWVFTMVVFLTTGAYLLIFKAPITDLTTSLNYHVLKPVSTESTYGTILTTYYKATTGSPPTLIHVRGTFGLIQDLIILPSWIYNYLWMLPISLFYIWLYRQTSGKDMLDIRVFLISTLLLLIFSKILTPQYLLWFLLLLPLLGLKLFLTDRFWSINYLIATVSALLYQFIYPVSYKRWIIDFYSNGGYEYLLAVVIILHLLLFFLLIRILGNLTSRKQFFDKN